MRPEDPVCSGDNLAYSGGAPCEEPWTELIQIGHAGRAAFQRRAANFIGVDFQDVSALRRYARILTRAEVWDEYGRSDAEYIGRPSPVRVPDDWQADDSQPAWMFVDRHDPRGFPVLIAEEQ